MKKQTFLALALFISLSFFVKAQTGYLGGDITWTCVGQDSFVIKVVLYTDCNQEAVPSSIQIPIKCKQTGSLIETMTINKPSPVDITPTCGASCTRCLDSNCAFPYGIEQYTFINLFVIPSSVSCCDISISFTACCRSKAFTNIQKGSPFHLEAWFNRCISPGDNSPTFTNPPIAIICRDMDFVFCHGVVDIDVRPSGGLLDSLSYEWTSPLISSTASVTYNSSFTYDKPISFWGYPHANLPFPRGFHLDKVVGQISFRPDSLSFSSMAEKVTEHRNGQIIGEITRDIAIIVIQCPKNNAPVLAGPFYKEVVSGNAVNFSISTNDYDTKDTLLISWNGAIPGGVWTDNNKQVKHPTGQLTWTPTLSQARAMPYTFTVRVKDDACPINAGNTRAYQILVRAYPKSIEESIIESITIYPNPATNKLVIELDQPTLVNSIKLFNSIGEIMLEKGESYIPTTLELNNLNSGVYILQIEMDTQKIQRQILIK
ncbi:MAG: T9SS type A sorting domain-containing protein [Bacteroidetes bacterium]|nr:T9SS type A sorting domain-containing protein [Bacteroidota bacterium]MBT4728057.1 T9SS type A sorting domain-containing protein [Bacteroidota bacterium]MBT7994567.1 T9SS type A sorting domain-containing protein [Bacteroidota bacterium]